MAALMGLTTEKFEAHPESSAQVPPSGSHPISVAASRSRNHPRRRRRGNNNAEIPAAAGKKRGEF